MKFICDILNTDPQICSSNRECKNKLKVQTVIAILSNIKNKKSILLQKLFSNVAFSMGLRDKGFDYFNKFEITTSMTKMRSDMTKWSKDRKCADEIDYQSFLRASFDNLNWKMKFGNTIRTGGGQKSRMFNAITGQVTFRKSDFLLETIPEEELVVKELIDLKEEDFMFSDKNKSWKLYTDTLFEGTDQDINMHQHLKSKLFSYTPNEGDAVIFATVEEAMSASEEEVGRYILHLKKDLHIGEV